MLARPGIYVGFWGDEAYIGASNNVCDRVAHGPHLVTPFPADRIIVIVDRSGQMTWDEVQVGERLVYQYLEAEGTYKMRNREPNGGAIDPVRNGLVRDFVEVAMQTLRRENLLTSSGGAGRGHPSRPASRLARGKAGFAANPPDPTTEPVTYGLDACGVEARARVEGDTWTVLAGSEIRGSVMPSAHASASQRRIELLHSGGLIKRGDNFLLTRDLAFGSATGAAHFVVGCKTRADIWERRETAFPGSPRL